MKFDGDKEDLVKMLLEEVPELWVIKMDSKVYKTSATRIVHNSYNKAKAALINVMEVNFHHGWYWHKGSNNSFNKYGGQCLPNGQVIIDEKNNKKLAKELVNQLLEDGVFIIEKIN